MNHPYAFMYAFMLINESIALLFSSSFGAFHHLPALVFILLQLLDSSSLSTLLLLLVISIQAKFNNLRIEKFKRDKWVHAALPVKLALMDFFKSTTTLCSVNCFFFQIRPLISCVGICFQSVVLTFFSSARVPNVL